MSAIGPGDWVEFISRRGSAKYGFKKGSIYLVESMMVPPSCECEDGEPHPALRLRGMPFIKAGWCVHDFRPIYRPKDEVIENLKLPVPTELETA